MDNTKRPFPIVFTHNPDFIIMCLHMTSNHTCRARVVDKLARVDCLELRKGELREDA